MCYTQLYADGILSLPHCCLEGQSSPLYMNKIQVQYLEGVPTGVFWGRRQNIQAMRVKKLTFFKGRVHTFCPPTGQDLINDFSFVMLSKTMHHTCHVELL